MNCAMHRQRAIQLLRKAEQRVTEPRVLLLSLLLDAHKLVTADDLYHMALSNNADINLSTVYRNLILFKEAGLVAEFSLPAGQRGYRAAGEEDGPAVLCMDCGELVALGGDLQALLSDVISQHGFETQDMRLALSAHCTNQKCGAEMRRDA